MGCRATRIVKNLKNETMVNDGEVDQIRQSDSFGCGVRVFKNGNGFCLLYRHDDAAEAKAVNKAAETALIEGYEKYTLVPSANVRRLIQLIRIITLLHQK